MKRKPIVYVIAGPNGAGKTTFATLFLPKIADCRNFVNADLIAKGLSPFNVEAAAMRAGRLFLDRIHEQIQGRTDFGFETTLSGIGYRRLFRELRRKGYIIHLYFLWIPGYSLALKRIAGRVQLGGHDVPTDVVRRRYEKGLNHLFHFYLDMADYCAIFDNSSAEPRLVFERSQGKDHIILPDIYGKIGKGTEERK